MCNLKSRDIQNLLDEMQPKYPRSDRIIPLNHEAEMCLQIMLNTYGENKIRNDFIISTQNGKDNLVDMLLNE